MARLRVRIELSRGGVGVPLHKLAGVLTEAEKFLQLAGEDVRLEKGEWLGFDFDRESLHFTAEYVGPVTAAQVQAFHAAFDGATSLRRATIAQFARIADSIGEEEVIGFGLYASSDDAEPSEWRCLSRRDALRIAEEIQVLLAASGEREPASHLPAIRDAELGARIFGDRRDRGAEHQRVTEYVREVEASLADRIARVEKQVWQHDGQMQDLRTQSEATEQSVRTLLSNIEAFCGQATRQIEQYAPSKQLPAAQPAMEPAPVASEPEPAPEPEPDTLESAPPALQPAPRAPEPAQPAPAASAPPVAATPFSAPAMVTAPAIVSAPAMAVAATTVSPATAPTPFPRPHPPSTAREHDATPVGSPGLSRWFGALAAAVLVVVGVVALATWLRDSPSAGPPAPVEVSAASPPPLEVGPAVSPDAPALPMRIELEVAEPVWVTLTANDGTKLLNQLLNPGPPRTIELPRPATLRAGNAGGLTVRVGGKSIGPIGPTGAVREIHFGDGSFKIATPQ